MKTSMLKNFAEALGLTKNGVCTSSGNKIVLKTLGLTKGRKRYKRSTVTSFIRDGLGLRPIMVNDSPLFILDEVIQALWLTKDQASDVLKAGQWGTAQAPNGLSAIMVNESALYSLAFVSRHPKAQAFSKWVTAQLLPMVRQSGSFEDRRA